MAIVCINIACFWSESMERGSLFCVLSNNVEDMERGSLFCVLTNNVEAVALDWIKMMEVI